MTPSAPPRFLTPPTVAKRLGVSADKILGWIRSGELRAIDVSQKPGLGRPRYRIDPADLAAFENGRAAVATAKAPRRRRRVAAVKEYF